MLSAHRTFVTTTAPDVVYAYLSDFTHAEEWDPGTVECTRVDGDGGVGTRYRNVSKFLGRETELDYKLEKLVPGKQFVITGANKTVISQDTVTITPTATGGTEVEYRADMTFQGVAGVISPLLAPFLKKLADDTQDQLLRTLDAKASA